jgi:hypothetical protein
MIKMTTTRKELKEAREILKPVLKAEKKLRKAAKALVVAKLALAHALVETNVESNPTLSAWTEGVLSGDDASVQEIYDALSTKNARNPAAEVQTAPLKIIKDGAVAAKPVAKPKTTVRTTKAVSSVQKAKK